MVELSPSNAVVRAGISELEQKVRRLAALVAAASDLASILPANTPDLDRLQQLLAMAEEMAPITIEGVDWVMRAFLSRAQQITPLLKSAA